MGLSLWQGTVPESFGNSIYFPAFFNLFQVSAVITINSNSVTNFAWIPIAIYISKPCWTSKYINARWMQGSTSCRLARESGIPRLTNESAIHFYRSPESTSQHYETLSTCCTEITRIGLAKNFRAGSVIGLIDENSAIHPYFRYRVQQCNRFSWNQQYSRLELSRHICECISPLYVLNWSSIFLYNVRTLETHTIISVK